MLNQVITSVFFSICSLCLFSQELERELISSQGNHNQINGTVFNWSLGEPIIETVSNEQGTLTQGFHQAWLVVTSLNELSSQINLSVYPNPVQQQLYIETKDISNKGFFYVIYDYTGKSIKEGSISQDKQAIDLTSFAASTYMLLISHPNNKQTYNYQLIKVK